MRDTDSKQVGRKRVTTRRRPHPPRRRMGERVNTRPGRVGCMRIGNPFGLESICTINRIGDRMRRLHGLCCRHVYVINVVTRDLSPTAFGSIACLGSGNDLRDDFRNLHADHFSPCTARNLNATVDRDLGCGFYRHHNKAFRASSNQQRCDDWLPASRLATCDSVVLPCAYRSWLWDDDRRCSLQHWRSGASARPPSAIHAFGLAPDRNVSRYGTLPDDPVVRGWLVLRSV